MKKIKEFNYTQRVIYNPNHPPFELINHQFHNRYNILILHLLKWLCQKLY